MSEVKIIKVQSKFKALDLVSFNVVNREDISNDVDPLKITYEISINFNIDDEKRAIIFNCPVKIFGDSEKNILLGSIETKAEFQVENLSEIMNDVKGIPTETLATFVGLLISSTRGMLTILSKATSFEKGIIPIINPMVFFQSLQQTPKI
jgi:hypothetical protein